MYVHHIFQARAKFLKANNIYLNSFYTSIHSDPNFSTHFYIFYILKSAFQNPCKHLTFNFDAE